LGGLSLDARARLSVRHRPRRPLPPKHAKTHAKTTTTTTTTQTTEQHTNYTQLSVFRLQFVLGYNWARRAPSLDYRLTTKWGDGPRIRRKERVSA
jgi:hypothetical protein